MDTFSVPKKRWLRCFLLHTLFSMAFWILIASNLSSFSSFFGSVISSSSSSSSHRHQHQIMMPFSHKIARFLCFMASQVVFLLGIAAITRPEEEDVASASDIFFGVLKLAWRASIGASLDRERVQEVSSLTARLQTSRDRSLFIFLCSISGSLSMLSFRWDSTSRLSSMEEVCRGASVGVLYAVLHLYRKRMVLAFPVIQVIILFNKKATLLAFLSCLYFRSRNMSEYATIHIDYNESMYSC